ncbi:MAG: phosphatase PAP2 family protein [Verrucomicrobia bacterium]|nr:phosphatase PAP2 family protein [Verrucomicrobiota bacterium]
MRTLQVDQHRFLVRLVMLLSVLSVALAGGAWADFVTDWNQTTLMLNPSQGTILGGRTLAMVHTAMYDSIVAFDGGYTPYYVTAAPPSGASRDAAATAAAYTVLSSIFTAPAHQATLQARYESHLALIPDGAAKTEGIAFGQSVGLSILGLRSTDGAMAAMTTPHPDGTEPGEWRRTASGEPMAPGWGSVTPWAMASGSQFDQGGPPPLTSEEYALCYEETRLWGAADSALRDQDQTDTAIFWMEHVPRHWHGLARDISQREGLSLVENAHLFALLSVTIADSNIAVWDMKYSHNFWRPETAIHLGDEDTNGTTVGDPTWESLIASPAFPEYVSGHSFTSGSAAALLELYFGSGNYTFELTSMMNPELGPRTYSSFWEAAEEAGISRIWGGIHFQFSNEEGLMGGQELARYVYGNCMTPVPEPSTLVLLAAGGLLLLARLRRA